MPDILLIQPPMEEFYLTAKRTIPYGLASIAAALRRQGFSVAILDALGVKRSKILPLPEPLMFLEPHYREQDLSMISLFHRFRHYGYSFEHIGTVARDMKPFLVGISSLFTPYGGEALKTAESVKLFWPDCSIVMGGHHPTQLPEWVMACRAVDYVLRGEGEQSMPALAEAVKYKKSPVHVPGIVFRRGDGSLHMEAPAWVDDLDTLPVPAMDLVNQKQYTRKGRGSTVIVAGRGCPLACSYCSVGASSSHGRFRQRSVKSVIAELESRMADHDIGFVDFEDENLTLNRGWFLSLLAEVKQRFGTRGIELRAMNGLFPPSLDEEMVAAMARTGFKTLNLSLGSTDREQLRRFKRPDVRESLKNALSYAEKCGMEAVTYLIAAAPGQDPVQSVKDLIALSGMRTLVGLSIYYPAPGSADYHLCKTRGLLPENFFLMRSTALPVSDKTSRLQAVTLLRLSRILNFMKFLVDNHETIPEASPWDSAGPEPVQDRRAMTKRILKWFLYDGIIRGVTPDGRVFQHPSDKKLTGFFLNGLKIRFVRGVKL